MNNTNTGGPAFPTQVASYEGMALRDYFASRASEEDINQSPQPPAPAPGFCKNCKDYTVEAPLAEQPAQRKPLTDEEIEEVWQRVQASDFHDCVKPFARAIEAAHGIKENT